MYSSFIKTLNFYLKISESKIINRPTMEKGFFTIKIYIEMQVPSFVKIRPQTKLAATLDAILNIVFYIVSQHLAGGI